MSRYGTQSRRMLSFLASNPGSTAREVSEHLFDDRKITQLKVRYKRGPTHRGCEVHTQWQAKRYVMDYMVKSRYYYDVEILDEREQLVSKICRGKFAYLTSPYNSRTLSADPRGSRPHPGAANRNAQRCWFHRTKDHDDIYRYFLTLKGMAALREHGCV
jgi:hypothetical protein